MPGPVLTITSSARCAHAGTTTVATPVAPRVFIDGVAVATVTTTFGPPFAACTAPSANLPPCATVNLTIGPSARVLANGAPVVVASSSGNTVPNGVPALATPSQQRVIAT